jgi:hypothetical protein
MTKSWKVEVIADSTGKWCSIAMGFQSKEDADAYGADLYRRWTVVQQYRSVESADPVNKPRSKGWGATQ